MLHDRCTSARQLARHVDTSSLTAVGQCLALLAAAWPARQLHAKSSLQHTQGNGWAARQVAGKGGCCQEEGSSEAYTLWAVAEGMMHQRSKVFAWPPAVNHLWYLMSFAQLSPVRRVRKEMWGTGRNSILQ